MSSFAETVSATTIADLQARGSTKWTVYPDAIGAWVAEMDFGLADPIKQALRDMDERFFYGYAPPSLTRQLREAASAFMGRRYGWTPDPDTVVPTSDVLHALGLVMDGFVAADAPIVLLTPCYMPFLTIPKAFGRRIVQVPMVAEPTWQIDFDALRAALTPGALFVLATPLNPIGRVLTREELLRIAEVVEDAGARVFADEIHAPLTFTGHQHVPYASVSPEAAAHSISAVSASKAWNLAGLKCAQIIFTNPSDLDVWRSGIARKAAEPANAGIFAGIAAYSEGEPWLVDVLAYLDTNRRLFADTFAARVPQARVSDVEGTYLQWVDLNPLGLDTNPHRLLLDEARVAVTDGALCGEVGAGCFRFNLAMPTPVLSEALDRITGVLNR